MNGFKKAAYRVVHVSLNAANHIMNMREPFLLEGVGCLAALPAQIKTYGVGKVMIVTGSHVSKMPQFEALLNGLVQSKIEYTVFKDVSPNPTARNVKNAYQQYIKDNCNGIVAFGGGSPMDCAKAAAALLAHEGKSISDIRGYFRVKGTVPPLFAVPTTSGSGSEASVSAVITDEDTHDKFSINDIKLIPILSVLDPQLTVSLPAFTTATTGMDALTHAVEAYIGKSGTRYTNEKAIKAVELIFDCLETAYRDGNNLEARDKMAHASYDAGCAFTRAFVGYVHAIAHSLGGYYNIPHGLANAVILPVVLEFYGKSVYKKLANLAVAAKIGTRAEAEDVLAKRFIQKIEEMNRNMGIPRNIPELKAEDIPSLAAHAIKEANPFYPVPKIMDQNQCEGLIQKLL